MIEAAWAIALSVVASLLASVLFLLSLTRFRPRVDLSAKVARGLRGDELSYAIKVINRTRTDLIDVKARLEVLETIPDVRASLTRRRDIPLRFGEILILPRYDKADKTFDYAFRFTTSQELSARTIGKNTIIRFSLIAKHSVSGFSAAFEQRYRLSDLVDGYFETGDTFSIRHPDDEDMETIRSLLNRSL